MSSSSTPWRLAALPLFSRLAIALLILVILGGELAAVLHMSSHHGKRDGQAGLTLVDIEGTYHGVRTDAPLRVALEAGHPSELEGREALPAADLAALLAWLELDSNELAQQWDNEDLGDAVPADLLDMHCADCHAATSDESLRSEPFLGYLDDVRAVSSSREILPNDTDILLASTHTHALSMGMIALVIVLLAQATGFGAGLVGLLALLCGGSLLVDLSCWWLARDTAAMIPILVGAGAVHMLSLCLLMALIVAELLFRPGFEASTD
ncbi:MAG: hypothetical protein ACI8QC_000897 [Planctomycetota bacterium]|jgi:hypothetical protein